MVHQASRFVAATLFGLFCIGCGDGQPEATPPIIESTAEKQKVDVLIGAVDNAIGGKMDAASIGLMLQENISGLSEAHPGKEAVINDIGLIGQRLQSAPSPALLQQAKEKLSQLK